MRHYRTALDHLHQALAAMEADGDTLVAATISHSVALVERAMTRASCAVPPTPVIPPPGVPIGG